MKESSRQYKHGEGIILNYSQELTLVLVVKDSHLYANVVEMFQFVGREATEVRIRCCEVSEFHSSQTS